MQANRSMLDLYKSLLVIFRDLFLPRQVRKRFPITYSSFLFHLKIILPRRTHDQVVFIAALLEMHAQL